MSSETTNIGLVLPELPEAFDLEGHWNHNSRIIDAEIGALKQTTAEHTRDIEGLKQTTTAQAQLIAGKQDTLTFDTTPTADSSNPVTSAGIKAALTTIYSSIFGLGEEIPANADLNSYLKPGRYYGGNDAGNTISNFPVANGRFGFTVKVEQMTSTNFYQYVYICNQANDGYVYRRRYLASSQTFNPWYRFDGSSLQSTQSAPASLMQAGRLDAELTDAAKLTDAQEVTDDA